MLTCMLVTVSAEADKKVVGVDWINAIAYGFNNNGYTANDEIMAKYIKEDYMTPLYFPPGTYGFNKGFNFPDLCHLELDARAELKLIGSEVQDYFITLRKGSTRGDYAFNSYIRGGFINANNKAKNGIGVYKTRHVCFENFILKNVLEKGIVTRTEEHADGHSYFNNILVENDYGIKGTVGVYDNALDTHFNEVEVVNFETAFYTIAGRFDFCSAWLRDGSIVENSLFAYIAGYDIIFHAPAVDTYQYGFKIDVPGYSVNISDMLWITNTGVYPDAMQKKHPRCMFNASSDECVFAVSGIKVNEHDNIAFSNIPLPSSSFVNLRLPNNYESSMVENFRDDTKAANYVANAYSAVKRRLTAMSNFDMVIETGVYECELTSGEGGKNAPPLRDSGILEVVVIGDVITQKFMGGNSFAHRVMANGEWQNWVVSSGNAIGVSGILNSLFQK